MAKMRKVTVVQGVGTLSERIQSKSEARITVRQRHHRARLAGGESCRSCPTIHASSYRPGRLEAAQPRRNSRDWRRHHRAGMGTVFSTLGARLDVVEMLDGLMLGADRDLVRGCGRIQRLALRSHHAEDKDPKAEAPPRPESR
jgi:dihydrolipoamide dehydrogenase